LEALKIKDCGFLHWREQQLVTDWLTTGEKDGWISAHGVTYDRLAPSRRLSAAMCGPKPMLMPSTALMLLNGCLEPVSSTPIDLISVKNDVVF
jgi:hypothetical protein